MNNELNIRLKPAIESPSSTKVPLDGEIVLVKDTSNSANNNIRIGDGSTSITSLPNFLTLSSGGGATYQTSLNGTSYGDTGGTSLGSWYAPTSVGTSGDVLISNGSGAPSWRTPTSVWMNFTTETSSSINYLRISPFVKASTTNINTASTFTVTDESSWSSSVYDSNLTFYRNYGLKFQKVTVGNGGTYQDGLAIALKTASSGEIGGIKVSSTSAGTISSVASSGNYYPVQLNSSNQACVRVPNGSGTVPGVASVNNDNPGLLKVAEDQDSTNGYINTAYVTAVPIFYGTLENTYYYDKGDDGETPYSKGAYEKGETFTGHYVNIHDIVNGLIRNQDLLRVLADALGLQPKQ